MNLSPHFTLEEAIFSSIAIRAGIDNHPTQDIVANMVQAAAGMEKVRTLLGERPIHVDSWYRCLLLNKAVHGAEHSDHMQGWCIDFICPSFGTPTDIVKAVIASSIIFDRIILEGTWVHVSFAPALRRQIETAHFTNGVATYTTGVS